MSPELDTPVVLITGATGPLGRAVAPRFARDGARLALVGRDHGRLAELGEGLGVASDLWMPVPGDLTVAGSAERGRERGDGPMGTGSTSSCISSAAGRAVRPSSTWSTTRCAACSTSTCGRPSTSRRRSCRGWSSAASGGSSRCPRRSPRIRARRAPSYAVAKAAEEALVRSLAREVSGSGVTANLVLVRTLDPNHERETAPTAKNASWATPEEVAETMVFLASPAAAAVNGARIPLYGRG